MEKPFWVKAGKFGWIRTDDPGYEFENVSEDIHGRDEHTFFYNKEGPFTSICVSGSQPG